MPEGTFMYLFRLQIILKTLYLIVFLHTSAVTVFFLPYRKEETILLQKGLNKKLETILFGEKN